MRFIQSRIAGAALALLLCSGLQACAHEPATPPVSQKANDSGASESFKHFEAWLEEFRAEAMGKGISKAVLDDAFADIDEPVEDVITQDKSQPEVKKTFPQYVRAIVAQKKISASIKAWQDNEELLTRVQAAYHVPPQYVVALWGSESNFGKMQGRHSLIESLTTLAYDGRRAKFFRGELLNALRIMQQEKIKSADLLGSWAGAMGQTQFMPSSYLNYAVDFNGDGKKDIWNSKPDALASIANYLHQKGWNENEGWGVEVKLPEDSTMDWPTMKERLPLATWKKMGIRQRDGKLLQGIKQEARLVIIDNDPNMAFLVYPNYDVLMDWNRSVYFATTIGFLANAMGEAP